MFLILLCEMNPLVTGVYVELAAYFREWAEKLYLKSETEVGKGAQGPLMAARQADITKPW